MKPILETLKEKINDLNIFEKYKKLREDWEEQNVVVDTQKAALYSRDRKIVALTEDKEHLKEKIDKTTERYKKRLSNMYKKNTIQVEKLQKELLALNNDLFETEMLRKKSAGKVGGYTKEINKLRAEKTELHRIIENLNKEIKKLQFSKTVTMDKLEKYELKIKERGKVNEK